MMSTRHYQLIMICMKEKPADYVKKEENIFTKIREKKRRKCNKCTHRPKKAKRISLKV